jgi:uncharacterized membrane protein (UPF0127 family)
MRLLSLVLVGLALASCGGTGGPGDDRAPHAVIATDSGAVSIDVEIADSEGERARGLMGRTELPEDAGMVFLFPEETSGPFWMKDTLIPLSIAFYDEDGSILRILDMDPCRRDPCPLYDPGVAFHGALEVNQGAFARWNVREGDRVRLER